MPVPEAAPEDPARAEADQRLHVLEAGAGRVLPRVEEVSSRSRRYGDDHAAIAASPNTIPYADASSAHPRAGDEQDRADHERGA